MPFQGGCLPGGRGREGDGKRVTTKQTSPGDDLIGPKSQICRQQKPPVLLHFAGGGLSPATVVVENHKRANLRAFMKFCLSPPSPASVLSLPLCFWKFPPLSGLHISSALNRLCSSGQPNLRFCY